MLKLAIALAALCAGPALAQSDVTATKLANAAEDKRICRALQATGSIMSTKVCRTRAQWRAADRESQRAMDNRRTSNTIDRSQGGTVGADGHHDSFGQ